ncbi:hypothetical protein [Actinopolyspora halophila]|uniref:hypothetical protein n=1 Tax=Actinopolyspora halophila TaxID=1850 RepID=UPI00036C0D01|nr:hypothetical protein [Actinopolyspora halophila]
MADHRDPSEHAESPERQSASAANPPEIVDAEVVPTPEESRSEPPRREEPPTGPAGSDDEEAFREYQQFLEFRRFQEWQRRYGDAPPPATTGGSPEGARKRPWYRRALGLLRFKAVRRLLYLLVIVLVLMQLYNSMFGGGGRDAPQGASGGGGGGGSSSAVLPESPKETAGSVYALLAGDSPTDVCLLFTETGKSEFAAAHGAENCAAAARGIHEGITNKGAYKRPGIRNIDIPRTSPVTLSSCDLSVSGGPGLGEFTLVEQGSGGWKIDSYSPAECGG